MTNTRKISSLSARLREQVNERLDHADSPESILTWLNSLPEVQAVLARKFKSIPRSPQNLSDYKQNSFRNWRSRPDALRFSRHPDELTDDEKLDNMRRRMFGVLPEDEPRIQPLARPQANSLNSAYNNANLTASPPIQQAKIQPPLSP